MSPSAPAVSIACTLTVCIALVVGLACALPGRPERILPEITGTVVGSPIDGPPARLGLVVIHGRTPSVHARREVTLSPDRRFRFEPLLLDVAGQEFGHHYRVYLHYTHADYTQADGTQADDPQARADRVIWRVQISRLEDATPIRLDCDLDRPIALGEPCRVVDPLAQRWLLEEGRRHFGRLCADCHGRDGRGGLASRVRTSPADPRPDADADHAPDLTRIATRNGGRFDRDAVAAWIEGRSLADGHARGAMPVWGERLASEFERYADGDELIGATLDPIVAYLESLQRRD